MGRGKIEHERERERERERRFLLGRNARGMRE